MHKSTTSKRKLPDTWLVVFFILVVIAILTWIVPSGSFDYETIDIDGSSSESFPCSSMVLRIVSF